MPQIDYSQIGLKCGLEIHQQLDSMKLFSHTPSVLRSDEPDFRVERKLHAVAGESGEIDEAAKYQASLEKIYEYEGYDDSISLVELDEEPPYEINQVALKTAMQIALLLNCEIIPITQIMRKTVIDGSNTSGFQRTVLIARNGFVETSLGRVGIESVCLEEDSARKIKTEGNKVVYRLDRLGIPLVEIATAPDIKSTEQAKEVALHLGEILRSCKVKRGIGTIRQDVNMSIKGGSRIELKGFQDIKNIENAIEKEALRQIDLVKKKKSVSEVRNVMASGESEFLRPMPGAARMYPETDLPLLRLSRDLINEVKRSLPKSRKEVESELEKKGLNQEMIKLLFKRGMIEEFKELLNVYDNPSVVVKVLLILPRDIASKEGKDEEEIEEIFDKDKLVFILESLRERKISESDLKHVMERIVSGVPIEEAIMFEKEDAGVVEEMVMKIVKGKPGLRENAYMGLVMKELKGKVDGKTAMELIKKYME